MCDKLVEADEALCAAIDAQALANDKTKAAEVAAVVRSRAMSEVTSQRDALSLKLKEQEAARGALSRAEEELVLAEEAATSAAVAARQEALMLPPPASRGLTAVVPERGADVDGRRQETPIEEALRLALQQTARVGRQQSRCTDSP